MSPPLEIPDAMFGSTGARIGEIRITGPAIRQSIFMQQASMCVIFPLRLRNCSKDAQPWSRIGASL
jgi:hypothetical protein